MPAPGDAPARTRATDGRPKRTASGVAARIYFGIYESSRPDQHLRALGRLLFPLAVAEFDDDAAAAYAPFRAALEKTAT